MDGQLSKWKRVLHIFIVVFAAAAIMGGSYALLVFTGLWDKVNSPEKIKNLILSMGFYGRSIFVLL